jgi:hypothetical protein
MAAKSEQIEMGQDWGHQDTEEPHPCHMQAACISVQVARCRQSCNTALPQFWHYLRLVVPVQVNTSDGQKWIPFLRTIS